MTHCDGTAIDIDLFGIEIELWRIGDSPVAPKFSLVSKPNEWSKTLRRVSKDGEGSGAKAARAAFRSAYWKALGDYWEAAYLSTSSLGGLVAGVAERSSTWLAAALPGG